MVQDLSDYVEDVVAPLIASRFPQAEREMIVLVGGSYGLGVGDRYSDLDAIVYLDDALWAEQGGHIQLHLQRGLPGYAAQTQAYCETPGDPYAWAVYGHSEFNVHPLSWVLGHLGQAFIAGAEPLPWEGPSLDEFFGLQHHLLLRDPHGVMAALRATTAPERYPLWLWRKRLIHRLCDVKGEPWELEKAAARGGVAEVQLLLGPLLRSLLELGYIVSRRCYPYRKYVWTYYARLPLATDFLADFRSLMEPEGWREPVAPLRRILDGYTRHILESGMLNPAMLEDLFAAREGQAWSEPEWHEHKRRWQEAAVAAGYDERDAWVWGLWGLDQWASRAGGNACRESG